MALIELDHIVKTYDLGLSKVPALRDIHFRIERGEFVAIVGQSGSGKSTLMNIIGCLDVPTAGQYQLSGRDVSTLSDDELADVRNLESRTGEEIVGLFLDLHGRGNTILLVTHEPKLAARCPRAVRLVDGLVIADGPGREVAMANAEALGAEALAQFHAAERAAQAGARP